MKNLYSRQIAPLTQGECLAVFDRAKSKFDFPIHFHPEYELNYLVGAKDARRVVGDHISKISDLELVLVGPNLIHAWEQGDCQNECIHEITILFHRDLFHETLLNREVMHNLRTMLHQSQKGIAFSSAAIEKVCYRIEKMTLKKGFESFTEFITILNELSDSTCWQPLSGMSVEHGDFFLSEKIKFVNEYIVQNLKEKIKLGDIAKKLNMTEISFGRFIKKATGRTFIDFVNDYRVGHATRLLIETQKSISEIVYESGFFNQANFNRIFKKKKLCSPKSFRNNYSGIRKIL